VHRRPRGCARRSPVSADGARRHGSLLRQTESRETKEDRKPIAAPSLEDGQGRPPQLADARRRRVRQARGIRWEDVPLRFSHSRSVEEAKLSFAPTKAMVAFFSEGRRATRGRRYDQYASRDFISGHGETSRRAHDATLHDKRAHEDSSRTLSSRTSRDSVVRDSSLPPDGARVVETKVWPLTQKL